jgi:hypothetical protein
MAIFRQSPDRMLDSISVACEVFDENPVSIGHVVSTRRALRALVAGGQLAELGRGFRGGRRMWCLPQCAEEYQARIQRHFGKRKTG